MVEHRVVVPRVVGSNPIDHPNFTFKTMSEDTGGSGLGSETWHIVVGMLVLVGLAIYLYMNGGTKVENLPRQQTETIAPQVIQ